MSALFLSKIVIYAALLLHAIVLGASATLFHFRFNVVHFFLCPEKCALSWKRANELGFQFGLRQGCQLDGFLHIVSVRDNFKVKLFILSKFFFVPNECTKIYFFHPQKKKKSRWEGNWTVAMGIVSVLFPAASCDLFSFCALLGCKITTPKSLHSAAGFARRKNRPNYPV